jgi:calcineurin-like phosphoesterase family protein
MVYFTSDTHFCHEKIIRLCGRPFVNIKQMNETLIQNWNSCITNDDEVYILGDFAYKGTEIQINKIVERLKGKKYLIKGNHDKFIDDIEFKKNFEWIKDYYVLTYENINFILFHYPILEWDGFFHDSIHLYGHVHNSGKSEDQAKRLEILGRRAINVGVDVNNFHPISAEKILEMIK